MSNYGRPKFSKNQHLAGTKAEMILGETLLDKVNSYLILYFKKKNLSETNKATVTNDRGTYNTRRNKYA